MKTYPLTKYYNITLFYVTFVLTIQKNSRFEPGTPVQLRPWIDCIFYLPSIEKFETLTIQKYKKCFQRQIKILMIRGGRKVILIHVGREKVIWAGARRKVNGPRAED